MAARLNDGRALCAASRTLGGNGSARPRAARTTTAHSAPAFFLRRWLRAAGRSVARRRPADRRNRPLKADFQTSSSWLGVQLLQMAADVGHTTCGTVWPTSVGLGRVALSYPDLPADVLSGKPLRRAAFCRTFSDCTTGPRWSVSGCFPLDPFISAAGSARIRVVRVTSRA